MSKDFVTRVIGKYSSANIYAKVIEPEAIDQIRNVCDQPFSEGSHIAVMPDVHSGVGCTIGFTMTLNDKVCPNLVGVDIGCGMHVTELGNIDIDFVKLDDIIHNYIPSGIDCRDSDNIEDLTKNPEYKKLIDYTKELLNNVKSPINENYELYRIASLGSGNHFIEVDEDSEGNKYLVIHSGSRHLGVSVCEHYMDIANENREGSFKQKEQKIKDMISLYKSTGRQKEIQSEIKHINDTFIVSESDDLAYVEGDNYKDYIYDMKKAQSYANINRELMSLIVCDNMGWERKGVWTTMHNYIDLERNILRKGAISLEKDMIALIPVSMRDGSLIVKGKGNPDYNYSGPHGAGRLMSRNEARKRISLDEFNKSMEGIYTTSVNESTIDESPFAYKSIDDILPMIEDTAEIVSQIKPLYNFKASDMRR